MIWWTVQGGGVYNQADTSSPTLINCSFIENSANRGGGMYNSQSDLGINDLLITNCTFTVNSANDRGGDIYNYDSSPILTNCILWADTAIVSDNEISNQNDLIPTITYSDINGDCKVDFLDFAILGFHWLDEK